MQVLGYDSRKHLVAVEMTARQVVEAGIDPWRIDLFDPDPLVLTQYPSLSFSRLRKVTFACLQGDVVSVGVFDGKQRVAFSGHADLDLLGARLPADSFSAEPQAFEAYLERFIEAHIEGRRNEHFIDLIWPPCEDDTVSLTGNKVTYHDPRQARIHWSPGQGTFPGSSYCGAMFERVKLPVPVDPRIKKVLERFGGWQPFVFGNALRENLLNEPLGRIDLLVYHRDLIGHDAVHARLRELGLDELRQYSDSDPVLELGSTFSFAIDGQPYRMSSHFSFYDRDEYWKRCKFSANQLVTDEHGSILASRIALHDILARNVRVLHQEDHLNSSDIFYRLSTYSRDFLCFYPAHLLDCGFQMLNQELHKVPQPEYPTLLEKRNRDRT